MYIYWAQIFLLPQKFLKKVNAICRYYLWTGVCNSASTDYVNWEDVRIPKCNGGLGFKFLSHWNMVMIGKQAWNIAMKAGKIWVNWVHTMYIQNHN